MIYAPNGRVPIGESPFPQDMAAEPEPQITMLPEPELEYAAPPEPIPDVSYIELYPVGKLSVSENRKDYVSGAMILEIPRLELTCPVVDGTDPASLKKGVGLFDYAQLPGPYNSNTSLAGHRDIYGKEFYYIDTITEGDYIYLNYEGKRYAYEYVETFITNDSDWEPVKAKDFACVTLQSCDPIGTSLNRIFVVGRLTETADTI